MNAESGWFVVFGVGRLCFEMLVRGFRQDTPCIDFVKTRNVIRTLIAGRESLEYGGARFGDCSIAQDPEKIR